MHVTPFQRSVVCLCLIMASGASAVFAQTTQPASGPTQTPPASAERADADNRPMPVSGRQPDRTGRNTSADNVSQARNMLAEANRILSRQAPDAATRWLLGMAATEDVRALKTAGKSALKQIEQARRQLQTLETDEIDELAELVLHVDTLASLASLMRLAGEDAGEQHARVSFIEAAIGFAAARESADETLATAAGCWQALAWFHAGRPQRALKVLPAAISTPQDDHFGFVARLLRCRFLLHEKQFTPAISFLTMMLERSEKWFPNEQSVELAQRQRLVSVMQSHVWSAWVADLREHDQDQAAEAVAEAQSKWKDILAQKTGKVYALPEALPGIVTPVDGLPLPTKSHMSPATSSAPASQPTSGSSHEPDAHSSS